MLRNSAFVLTALFAVGCVAEDEADYEFQQGTSPPLRSCDDNIVSLLDQIWEIQLRQTYLHGAAETFQPGSIVFNGSGLEGVQWAEGAAHYWARFTAPGYKATTPIYGGGVGNLDSEIKLVVPGDIPAGPVNVQLFFDTEVNVNNCAAAEYLPGPTQVTWFSNTITVISGPPTAIKDLQARTISPTIVELRWTDVDSETHYDIYGGPVGQNLFGLAGQVKADFVGAWVLELQPSTNYEFAVDACNANGCSRSNTAVATTPRQGATPAPPNPDGGATVEILADSNESTSRTALAPLSVAARDANAVEVALDDPPNGIIDDPNLSGDPNMMYPLALGRGNVPVQGKAFAVTEHGQADLAFTFVFPKTPGGNNADQYVSFHADIDYDPSDGRCLAIQVVNATGGDFGAGLPNRVMIAAPLPGAMFVNLSSCTMPYLDKSGVYRAGSVTGTIELVLTLLEFPDLHNSLVRVTFDRLGVSVF